MHRHSLLVCKFSVFVKFDRFIRHAMMQDTPAVDELGADQHPSDVADQFKREVAETFLRCIKERISHDNAVIELNGLKIAEDRTFADCAR